MADRYCRYCGHELRPDDRFCTGCGRAVHATAHVPTSEADVPAPPPLQQEGAGGTQQPRHPQHQLTGSESPTPPTEETTKPPLKPLLWIFAVLAGLFGPGLFLGAERWGRMMGSALVYIVVFGGILVVGLAAMWAVGKIFNMDR